MGLLNDYAAKGLNLLGANADAKVSNPVPNGDDFTSMTIVEYVNGSANEKDAVVLAGRFMPHIPFEFGGTQKLVREDYPGASEPTVQVLGPRESNVTVRGELKTNKFKDNSYRDAAVEYQQLIDAMRLRGNVVRITLVGNGENWVRYGFIEETKFRIKRLQAIEYDITFLIVGFNYPKGWKILNDGKYDPIKPNKEITDKALAALLTAQNYPATMPLTAADILNRGIAKVGSAIKQVTGFIDGVTGDANALIGSANRALGLIKNARATISRVTREIGQISMALQDIGTANLNPLAKQADSEKAKAALENVRHIHTVKRDFGSLIDQLARFQRQIEALAKTVPQVRVLVKSGDTLQKLAIKYYNDPTQWKKIYDHNRLTSTTLTVGKVLEIPK